MSAHDVFCARSTAVVSDNAASLARATPRSMRSHKPQALRTSHGLCSFFNAKLYEDVLDVRFNRFGSNGEVPCDFLVGKALGD
jgi:hypothetical protein